MLRSVFGLLLATAVAMAARYLGRLAALPSSSCFPPAFVTQSWMLVLSVAAISFLARGRLARFGFRRGTYRFSPRILLWILPTAMLSTLSALASPGEVGTGGPPGYTKLQMVVFIWIFASICEEILARGLVQTLLAGEGSTEAGSRRGLSLPVVGRALFNIGGMLPLCVIGLLRR